MAPLAVNGSTPITHVPMIMTHDAGTGYLNDGYRWWKTQPVGLSQQLECGARAFDARPLLRDGTLVWHHGSVAVNYTFAQSLDDVLGWLGDHPTELAILSVWDCEGDDCLAGVRSAFAARNITDISTCGTLAGLTLAGARELGALRGGGALLGVTGPGRPDGAACSEGNYDPTIACTGPGFGCWTTDKSREQPLGKMLSYLDAVAARPLPPTAFTQSQALWQESSDSVVIGTLRNSSLLLDEARSGLNALLARQVRARRWRHLNLLEVNNVCDGGPELWAAIQEVYYGAGDSAAWTVAAVGVDGWRGTGRRVARRNTVVVEAEGVSGFKAG